MSILGKRIAKNPPILEPNKKQAQAEAEAEVAEAEVEGDDCAICFMPLNDDDGQKIIRLE